MTKSGPNQPLDEVCRLAALHACHILDTEREPAFDEIVSIAAHLAKTPMAIVSLVDETRQWFKAAVGLSITEIARENSFCSHALKGTAPLTVVDARRDTRFAANPLVASEPGVRFYHGIPLEMADGARLGTLCVLDNVPRQLNSAQLRALRLLSRQVVAQLELRRERVALAHDRDRDRERRRDDAELATQILRDHEHAVRRHEELFQELAGLTYKLGALTVKAHHLESPLLEGLERLGEELRETLGVCRLIVQDQFGYPLPQNGWRDALNLRLLNLTVPDGVRCTVDVVGNPGLRLGHIARFRAIELIAGAVQRASQLRAKQIKIKIDGDNDTCTLVIVANDNALQNGAVGNGEYANGGA
jgi:hypothetical protein